MSNVAAVVVPSHELVEALNVEANGQSTPPCESLLDACMHEAHRSRARSLVLSSVHQCCKAAQLKAWETPQTLILEAELFSDANGLLTSLGKLCRPALISRYRARLCGNGSEIQVATADAPSTSAVASSHNRALCAGLVEILEEVAPTAASSGFCADTRDKSGSPFRRERSSRSRL